MLGSVFSVYVLLASQSSKTTILVVSFFFTVFYMFGRNIHLLEPLSCSCSLAGMSQWEKAVSMMCQENFWQVQSGEQRGIGARITLKFLTHVWVPYISTVGGVMSCSWGASRRGRYILGAS